MRRDLFHPPWKLCWSRSLMINLNGHGCGLSHFGVCHRHGCLDLTALEPVEILAGDELLKSCRQSFIAAWDVHAPKTRIKTGITNRRVNRGNVSFALGLNFMTLSLMGFPPTRLLITNIISKVLINGNFFIFKKKLRYLSYFIAIK